MTYSNNQFAFNIWFPGLENEKPARVLWTASDVEEAYIQLVKQYPDCAIQGVAN